MFFNIILSIFIIKFFNSQNILYLPLINNSYIQIYVGSSFITLLIDPTSNILLIFDKFTPNNYQRSYGYNEYSKKYRESSISLNYSNLFGNFSGKLVRDEFNFTFYDFNNNSPQNFSFILNFLLVEFNNLEYIPEKIDGILGLGTIKENLIFYQSMSLIKKMVAYKLINKEKISFDFLNKKLIFGDFEKNFPIKNKFKSKYKNFYENNIYFPIKLINFLNLKKINNNEKSEKEINIKLNATLIPLSDDLQRGIFISPDNKKNKFTNKILKSFDLLYTNYHSSNTLIHTKYYPNPDIYDAYKLNNINFFLNFNNNKNNIFPINWFYYSESHKKETLTIETLSSINNNIWNINAKNAFDNQILTYDYKKENIILYNCKYCGVNYYFKQNLIKLSKRIYLFIIILLLLSFTILYKLNSIVNNIINYKVIKQGLEIK